MKHPVLYWVTAASLLVMSATTVSAQSIRRIRQSIDRATGGQTAPAVPAQPPKPPAPALTPEQAAAAAAAQAAQQKRQKEAAAAAEAKVIPFLKQRVEEGSADAAADLAKRYETGKGVPEDPKEVRRLYQLAADRDNSEARVWLKEHPAAAKEGAAGKPAVARHATPAAVTAPAPVVPRKADEAK